MPDVDRFPFPERKEERGCTHRTAILSTYNAWLKRVMRSLASECAYTHPHRHKERAYTRTHTHIKNERKTEPTEKGEASTPETRETPQPATHPPTSIHTHTLPHTTKKTLTERGEADTPEARETPVGRAPVTPGPGAFLFIEVYHLIQTQTQIEAKTHRQRPGTGTGTGHITAKCRYEAITCGPHLLTREV
jgi:hypothetical protein